MFKVSKTIIIVFFFATPSLFAQIVTVSGSNSMIGLVKILMQSYSRKNNALFAITGKGSNAGFSDFIEGKSDFAMISRNLTPKEIEMLKQKNIDYTLLPIAKDALCVVTSIRNPLNKLNITQLQNIYTSKITNWKDFGGNDLKIKPLIRDKSSGTGDLFKEMVLKDFTWGNTCIEVPNTASILYFISESDEYIGFISYSFLDESSKCLSISFENNNTFISPNEEALKNGTYRFTRNFNILYRNNSPEYILKVINYLKSTLSKDIIESNGFINLQEK